MKITLKTKLKNVLNINGIEEILLKHRFPCISCPMAKMEMDTLEIGSVCAMYGIDEKRLLKEINEFIEVKDKNNKNKKLPKKKVIKK